jgi:hypothetical protein
MPGVLSCVVCITNIDWKQWRPFQRDYSLTVLRPGLTRQSSVGKDYNAAGVEREMAHSILDRLFRWGKRERGPLSLLEGARNAGTRVGAANSQGIQALEQKPVPMAKVNALFAFVDLKDPFVVGEIAGEELPGPILSILSAKCFANFFLFNTPHTRQNAIEIKNEVLAA